MVDLTKAKIGDTVIDNSGNTGVITDINLFAKYGYVVRFGSGLVGDTYTFTKDGVFSMGAYGTEDNIRELIPKKGSVSLPTPLHKNVHDKLRASSIIEAMYARKDDIATIDPLWLEELATLLRQSMSKHI